jgi:arylsulfatase
MATSNSSPNLLLITTDQQRHDTLRPHAPEFLRTPHLDLLQYEGVSFERAYAETPICVPSRTSLLTGRSVFEHGMTRNGPTGAVIGRKGTLPSHLRNAGYGTAAIGKMHFTPQRARHGFDETTLPEDYYRWIRESGSPLQPMRHGIGQNELFPAVATVPEALTLTSWIAERCVRYIREGRDPTCPFFLWASFTKPHPPLDPPEPYASMYRRFEPPAPVRGSWAERPDAPAAFRRQRERGSFDLLPEGVIEDARRAYYGLVTHVDHAIGRILSALQDMRLLDTTMIVFTSDHGEFLGDHGCGNKVLWHEPSARIPLIVRPPPALRADLAGTSCDALVTHTDVTATLLAAARAAPAARAGPAPAGDLVELAAGGGARREFLYGMATEARPGGGDSLLYLAATDGRWKYIWYPEGPAEQLFDLAADPQEIVDLAADGAPAAVRAGRRLAEAVREHAARTIPDRMSGGAELPAWPPRQDSSRERRAGSWPGFHTEYHDADVRH